MVTVFTELVLEISHRKNAVFRKSFWELGTQKCIKRRNFLRIGALLASNLLVVEKVALAQHSPMLKEKLVIETNGKKFTFSLWDNATTRDLISRLPLTIQFEDLYSREFCYRFPQPLKAEKLIIEDTK